MVGQEHQLIVAVKPDSILIEHSGAQYLCEKGLVSFTMKQLSADDAFQCIVHPKMLTGIEAARGGGESKLIILYSEKTYFRRRNLHEKMETSLILLLV